MELKVFFIKAILGTIKGCYTDNLAKTKIKSALHLLAVLLDPGLKNPAMTDR